MAELQGFEEAAEQAILEEYEAHLREEIGPALKRIARENFEAYASRHGYDIGFIWEEAELTVERSGDTLYLRIDWPELTALFEFGVEPHTITGDPLHFYWEAKDQWITTDEVNWGSETGGIPESRAVRDALNEIRRVMQG